MLSPVLALYGAKYVEATGLGCMVEVRLRLAIDTGSEATAETYEPPIKEVLLAFASQFQAKMEPNEAETLTRTITLRHKLAHGDFKAALRLVGELGGAPATAGVYVVDLGTDDDPRPVSELSKKEGRCYGWLLEGGNAGLFDEAIKIFARVISRIDVMMAE